MVGLVVCEETVASVEKGLVKMLIAQCGLEAQFIKGLRELRETNLPWTSNSANSTTNRFILRYRLIITPKLALKTSLLDESVLSQRPTIADFRRSRLEIAQKDVGLLQEPLNLFLGTIATHRCKV